MTWVIVLVAVLLLGLVGLYLSMTAGRLDRLHLRIAAAERSLDAHLLRRSSVAAEIAAAGILDPVASMLIAEAAHDARTSQDSTDLERSRAESDLTAALCAALDDDEDLSEAESQGLGAPLLAELAASWTRLELARRFHNDAVRACRQVRQQRLVRWLHLAGHTPLPATWEIDDAMPPEVMRLIDRLTAIGPGRPPA